MKKLLALPIFFLLGILLSAQSAYALTPQGPVNVGLFFADGALPTANLQNELGSGYRFGYFEGEQFVPLGSTAQTQISMLKTQLIYLKDGLYYAANPGGASAAIGPYHLQLPENYSSFEQAASAAAAYPDGFPAWIGGRYVARIGAYSSSGEASLAQGNRSLSSCSIVGTSAQGISVTQTKSATILFQFDGEGSRNLAVRPGLWDGEQTTTWFKGYRYYGDFIYQRLDGGNLTVSNRLGMDDYIKGVLPYEMSASWPLEALKAQAVCARSYTLSSAGNRHKAQNFDICNTTCCQVYRGLNNASANSDRAVTETSGICAYYGGKLAQTFYYASNGGASENVKNVWGSEYPYLAGAQDPYEASIAASINGYHWTVDYSAAQLTSRLQERGYKCSTIVDLRVTEYSPLGNVLSLVFVDSNGQSFSFTRERCRTILGLKSQRFAINGGSGGAQVPNTGTYHIDEGDKTVAALGGLYAVDATGAAQLPASGVHAITAAGTEALPSDGSAPSGETGSSAGTTTTAGTFRITGSGNGHHVGMSQWGANAMAKQGFSYQEILKFYFAGIDLY